MSQPEPEPEPQPAAPEQPHVDEPADDEPEQPHVDEPAGDDVERTDDEQQQLTAAAERNAFEEGLKELPEGYALCPMCIGAGAIPEEPPFDLHKHACPDCLGYGETRTGSVVNVEYKLKCETCSGRGWVQSAPGEPAAGPARAAEFIAGTARDYAGRTPDDPDFDWARVVRTEAASAAAAEPEHAEVV